MIRFIRGLLFGILVLALGLASAGCGGGADKGPKNDAPKGRNMETMQKKTEEMKKKYGGGASAEQADKDKDQDKDKDKVKEKDKEKDQAKEKDKKE